MIEDTFSAGDYIQLIGGPLTVPPARPRVPGTNSVGVGTVGRVLRKMRKGDLYRVRFPGWGTYEVLGDDLCNVSKRAVMRAGLGA